MTTYDQDYLDHFAHFIGELNKQLEVPVLESVEAFENMADNRHVAQMSCVLPAPLALVLYQRDPDFIADWFTWQEDRKSVVASARSKCARQDARRGARARPTTRR